jgi:hypothetical protein
LKAAGKKKEYEMRKSLLMGGAALLVLALVLSACNDGYNVTNTETITKLPDPVITVANKQKGVITLTWERDYNALRYDVYRQTGDTGPVVKLYGANNVGWVNPLFTDGTYRYDDIVSDTNELKADTKYTYTVVAVSSTSTGTQRGVDVVQDGVGKVEITIPATPDADHVGIPAKGDTSVITAVSGLDYAKVKQTNGSDALQIFWTKNPNPGVGYRLEFAGNNPYTSFTSSIDGSKVVCTYPLNNLTDGEKYKVKVTPYFIGDYYKAAATVLPAETEYTHSDPSIISNFAANVVTKIDSSNAATGVYEISLSWKEKALPAAASYKLYVHKGSSHSNVYEWTEVTGIGTPTSGNIGLKTLRLSGDKLPAYRQEWTYKLLALDASGEEIGSGTYTVENEPWSSSLNVGSLTFIPLAKTLRFEVSQANKNLLVSNEIVEFYAVPGTLYGVEIDTILANGTLIKSFTKGNLESDISSNRTAAHEFATGVYFIRAFVLNGTERTEVSYTVSGTSYGPDSSSYWPAFVPN